MKYQPETLNAGGTLTTLLIIFGPLRCPKFTGVTTPFRVSWWKRAKQFIRKWRIYDVKIRLVFAMFAIALLSSVASAQTEYDIPDGTSIDYIYYTSPYPYTNTFASDYPITVNGVSYLVDVSIHFVPGNPVATSGSITFAHYTITGATTVTENLTAINYNPFSLKTATAKADFAGTFTGSLTFNIQQFIRNPCNRYCAYDALTTVNGVHSNFTLDASQAADGGILPLCPPSLCNVKCKCDKAKPDNAQIYKCGSDTHDCLADGTGQCPKALPNCKPLKTLAYTIPPACIHSATLVNCENSDFKGCKANLTWNQGCEQLNAGGKPEEKRK